MSSSHSPQLNVDSLNETIHNLQLQVANISQRLESIEGKTQAATVSEEQSRDGAPIFLGRKFKNSEFEPETNGSTIDGRFLGNMYNLGVAKVEMQSDGTERRFLGRKFAGRSLKQ